MRQSHANIFDLVTDLLLPEHRRRSISTPKIITEKDMLSLQRMFPLRSPKQKLTEFVPRCLLISFLAAFALRTRLAMLNKRKLAALAAMSEDEKKGIAELDDPTKEISDSDPRYIFMT